MPEDGALRPSSGAATRVLVIRRDNIGDLVCTTPLIAALRQQLPSARICALVNRYNAPVLEGNSDLNHVYSYQKAKHRAPKESLAGIYARRLRTLAALRAARFDWALLPGGPQGSALRFARWIAPKHVLARSPEERTAGLHEVEQACSLLPRMGLRYETPLARLAANPAELQAVRARIAARLGTGATRTVGVHVSARRPAQRWPAERFVELIERLPLSQAATFILLWAPGSALNPQHPGDDEKAARIAGRLGHRPVMPVPTQRLETLIAALAQCDQVICADGGAMHLAAALGKPIVCLFGDTDASRWRPWGVPHVLLQPPSRNVVDIMVEDVMHAYEQLSKQLERGAH